MHPVIDIWADTADVVEIRALRAEGITGFTTNPTLMRRAGVTDYRVWALRALEAAKGAPLSLEVLADDRSEMEVQARTFSSWGSNVVVKIPITNTEGTPSYPLAAKLLKDGVCVNLTAVMSAAQMASAVGMIPQDVALYISIFAGRIADLGYSARCVIRDCRNLCCHHPKARFIWASTREIHNVLDAQEAGCDVITMPPAMIRKMRELEGKSLLEYSRETVMRFRRDALESGLTL